MTTTWNPGKDGPGTAPFIVQQVEKFTVVEFRQASLMDSYEFQSIAEQLYRLVDEQDKRRIIFDFEKVQYISSSAAGMLLNMHKKLAALPHSKFVLCSVSGKLLELIKIMRLEKVLTIKPTQREALNVPL
jgi:anti-anti-sigma factor